MLVAAIPAIAMLGQVCCNSADPLHKAFSTGRWDGVIQQIGGNPTGSPVGFLRAQTFLAGNHNNQAVCEILQEDLAALSNYQSFTRRLAGRYPKSAVAQYLLGDSLARAARWGDAVASFDRALAIDPNFVLARTARGVALISSGQSQAGKHDLYSALLLDPKFAEAQAAMGWTLLKEGQPATAARKYFDAAASLSPGYSLAAAGKGFAEVAGGDTDKGADEVTAQLKPGNCAVALLVSNSLMAASWVGGAAVDNPGDTPGTQINVIAITQAMLQTTVKQGLQGNQQALSRLESILGASPKNPVLQSMVKQTFASMDPPAKASLIANLQPRYDAMRPGGSIDKLINQTRVVEGVASAGLAIRFPWVAPAAVLGGAWSETKFNNLEHNLHQSAIGVNSILNVIKPMAPDAAVPRMSPGGATTSLTAARLDRGNWPFEPIFGLLYPKS
jgi:tetratricopeptide (TPR) repeat protein